MAYTEQGNQPFATEWRRKASQASASVFDQTTVSPEPLFDLGGIAGYETQMADFFQICKEQFEVLRTNYVFDPADGVRSFLEGHRAVSEVLMEAVTELRRCFGSNAILQLQLLDNEGTSAAIYGIVLWQGDLQSARAALQTFDETWWIESSRRAAGRIVFDYQLV
jgi:hypothetical protein